MPSLADTNILEAPDGVYLLVTLLQVWGQLTRTQVIYSCMIRVNADVMGNPEDFLYIIQEEQPMLLYYVPHDASLRPQFSSLLARWVHIRFSNWLV